MLHNNGEPIIIGKIRKAMFYGHSGFLETKKKGSKKPELKPLNISPEKEEKEEKIYNLEREKFQKIETLLKKVCSDNPLDPAKTKYWMKAEIKLIDPKNIVKVKPMLYSPMDREEFAKQISELLQLKIIKPSKSSHMSPAFLVENEAEKRRKKKRMVVNYKKMNEATIGDSHNLPKKEELLTLIRGKKIFSSFNCKSGFWQVLLDEESQKLTAFTCPQGHYQWNVVPFGFKQAPIIFQRHMQNAFRSYEKYSCVYVDDILVFSNTEKEHYLHVVSILKRCDDLGIILSEKKSNLFKTKINFLGLELDEGQHRPQQHIIEHIQKFPDKIEDKKQLQRFLGILTYAESYIPKLAEMRKPLQAKLKVDTVWNWTDSDSKYVKKVKAKLTSFPFLYHPLPEDKLIIETDASDNAWGGILKAVNNDTEHICRYTSGSFKEAETRYHSNDKEILAVIRVIEKFSIYLTPVKFLIRTDNKNFTYFVSKQVRGDNKQGRLVRWQMFLSRYSFDVEHISGKKNVFADFLTRECISL